MGGTASGCKHPSPAARSTARAARDQRGVRGEGMRGRDKHVARSATSCLFPRWGRGADEGARTERATARPVLASVNRGDATPDFDVDRSSACACRLGAVHVARRAAPRRDSAVDRGVRRLGARGGRLVAVSWTVVSWIWACGLSFGSIERRADACLAAEGMHTHALHRGRGTQSESAYRAPAASRSTRISRKEKRSNSGAYGPTAALEARVHDDIDGDQARIIGYGVRSRDGA